MASPTEEDLQRQDSTGSTVAEDVLTFIPPSIHRQSLISGESYTHYTPVPPLVHPRTRSGPTSISTSKDDNCPTTTGEGTPCILGVDEAGRGPVIGPMVYSAFYLPSSLHHSLLAERHHFDDSKVLSPAVRARLAKAVCTPGTDLHDACGWAIKSLSARDIGAGMLRGNNTDHRNNTGGGSYNLNAQAMDATVEIISGVLDCLHVNVTEVYIDTIGNPATYQKKLERIFPTVKITVEKKADSLYPCVSAASVIAKVTRDLSCEVLCREVEAAIRAEKFGTVAASAAAVEEDEGAGTSSWGSGYPSDARCVAWLKTHMDVVFGWGSECRFSWGTVKDMLEKKSSEGGLQVDWPANDDDDDDENRRLSEFFLTSGSAGTATAAASGSAGENDQLRLWFGSSVGQEAF